MRGAEATASRREERAANPAPARTEATSGHLGRTAAGSPTHGGGGTVDPMEQAPRSDDRPQARTPSAWRARLMRLVRSRPRAYLILLACSLVVALGAPRWFGGGTAAAALVLVAFLGYGAGLVVLAIAIAGDDTRPDTAGRRRAILTVLTGGLAALPWVLEEARDQRATTDGDRPE